MLTLENRRFETKTLPRSDSRGAKTWFQLIQKPGCENQLEESASVALDEERELFSLSCLTSSKTFHSCKSLCSLKGSIFLLIVPLNRTGSYKEVATKENTAGFKSYMRKRVLQPLLRQNFFLCEAQCNQKYTAVVFTRHCNQEGLTLCIRQDATSSQHLYRPKQWNSRIVQRMHTRQRT